MAKLKDRKKKLKILAGNTNKMDETRKVDQSNIRGWLYSVCGSWCILK